MTKAGTLLKQFKVAQTTPKPIEVTRCQHHLLSHLYRALK